jgi:hypothetical protein
MSRRSHWGSLWTAIPRLEEDEGIRRFVDAELEETRAFVRRLLAEHQRLAASGEPSSVGRGHEKGKKEGSRSGNRQEAFTSIRAPDNIGMQPTR